MVGLCLLILAWHVESRALDGIGMWSALLEGLAHEEELLVFVHSAEVELEELLSRTRSGELGAASQPRRSESSVPAAPRSARPPLAA